MNPNLQRLSTLCSHGAIAEAELELYQWQRQDDCPSAARVMLASLLSRRGRHADAQDVLQRAGYGDADTQRMLRCLQSIRRREADADIVDSEISSQRLDVAQAHRPQAGIERDSQACDACDRGKLAFEAHLLDEAENHARCALTVDPEHAQGHLLLARIHLRRDRAPQALATLDALQLLHARWREAPELILLRVEALTRCGLDAPAVKLLEELNLSFPADVRFARMLAAHYRRSGKTDAAITALGQAEELEATDLTIRRVLAQHLHERSSQQSIAVLCDPKSADDPIATFRAAQYCESFDRLADAEALYLSLHAKVSDDSALAVASGRLADALGDDGLAVARLEHAAAQSGSRDTTAAMALAIVHMHAGRFRAATAGWFKTTRRDPLNPLAWAGFALCGAAAGQPKVARRAMQRLRQLVARPRRRALLAQLWPHAAAAVALHSEPTRAQKSSVVGRIEPLRRAAA